MDNTDIIINDNNCLRKLDFLKIEIASQRTRLSFFLELAQKLNIEFLEKNDALEILKAVLIGTTAGEGLGFNRAFWFTMNRRKNALCGDLSVGPWDAQEATVIWEELRNRPLTLFEMLEEMKGHFYDEAHPLNRLVRSIEVPLDDPAHFLVRALRERRPIVVEKVPVDQDWPLSDGPLAAAPVATGPHSYGVIVCDNHILKHPIEETNLEFLVLLTTISSMAFTKARMCALLRSKITELEGLTREMAASRRRLAHVEKTAELGLIADRVLHEIKNPLSAVGGLARLLERRSSDQDMRKIASRIVEGARKIECTIDGLFSFADGPDIEPERVKIRTVLETLFKVISIDLEEREIEGHFSINIPDDTYLMLDVGHFQQALYHLIHNSLKCMGRGGILIVTAKPCPSGVEVEISDSGDPLSHELHTSKSDAGHCPREILGLGLGLSLAKQIVELHGGTFSLFRNKMGGNTMRIVLPQGGMVG